MVHVAVVVGRLRILSNLDVADARYDNLSRKRPQMAVSDYSPACSVARPQRRMLRSCLESSGYGHPDFELFPRLLRITFSCPLSLTQIIPIHAITSLQVEERRPRSVCAFLWTSLPKPVIVNTSYGHYPVAISREIFRKITDAHDWLSCRLRRALGRNQQSRDYECPKTDHSSSGYEVSRATLHRWLRSHLNSNPRRVPTDLPPGV
jgi:hypothetical protein